MPYPPTFEAVKSRSVKNLSVSTLNETDVPTPDGRDLRYLNDVPLYMGEVIDGYELNGERLWE